MAIGEGKRLAWLSSRIGFALVVLVGSLFVTVVRAHVFEKIEASLFLDPVCDTNACKSRASLQVLGLVSSVLGNSLRAGIAYREFPSGGDLGYSRGVIWLTLTRTVSSRGLLFP